MMMMKIIIVVIIIIIIIIIIINSPFTLVFFPLVSASYQTIIQRSESCKSPQFKRQPHAQDHQIMFC